MQETQCSNGFTHQSDVVEVLVHVVDISRFLRRRCRQIVYRLLNSDGPRARRRTHVVLIVSQPDADLPHQYEIIATGIKHLFVNQVCRELVVVLDHNVVWVCKRHL